MLFAFLYLLLRFSNCFANLNNTIDNDYQSVREKRGVIKHKDRFSTTIKYTFDDKIEFKNILRAFSDISSLTCLRFEKTFKLEPFVIHIKSGSSNRVGKIGPTKNGPTSVQVNSTCLGSLGCVKHMLGLALGLDLETNRHDRDKYVELLKENIKKDELKWFKKKSKHRSWVRNTGFDYGSLMTPSIYWKSKNGEPVFKSKLSKYYDFMVGQRIDFSFNDIKQLNDFYCGKVCKSRVRGCTNGGYADPKRCKKCRCPPGFIGQQCTQVKHNKDKKCGKRIRYATRNLEDLFVEGKNDCYFYIRAPRYKKVRIAVPEVNTQQAVPCHPGNGVEIRYRHNKGATGLCLCGTYRKYSLNLFNSRVLIHYKGLRNEDKLHIRYRFE